MILNLQYKQHLQGFIGGFSSLLVSCVVQPFEIIKMVMIVKPNKKLKKHTTLTHWIDAIKYIRNKEGLKGFYRGLGPALIRNVTVSFLYFHLLSKISSFLRQYQYSRGVTDFASSFLARGISNFLTNPLQVIETRCEVPGFNSYSNVIDAIIKIQAIEGSQTFFKGAMTCTLKEAQFAGIYYLVYQQIREHAHSKQTFNPSLTFTAGMIAGLLGTAASHPLEIIRARLQTNFYNGKYSTMATLAHIYKEEGLLGQNYNTQILFLCNRYTKGLAPRLIKKPLANSLTFLLVEQINHLIDGKQFDS